jgi:Zinc knuckle
MEVFKPRSIEEITGQAQKLGIEGKELKKFVESQQRLDLDRLSVEKEKMALAAEERKHVREMEEKRLEREQREKLEISTNSSLTQSKVLDKNLKTMTESEDLMYYLELFEITAVASGIPKTKWPLLLTHKLNDKLRMFMVQMRHIHSTDYDYVKHELLKQAELTEEACRTKWHELSPKSDDIKEFYVNLQRTFENWINAAQTPMTVEGIIDLIMRDRIYSILSEEALKEIILRKPTTAKETLDCIDQYKDANKGASEIVKKIKKVTIKDTPYVVAASSGPFTGQRTNPGANVFCYRCRKTGHLSYECRSRQNNDRYYYTSGRNRWASNQNQQTRPRQYQSQYRKHPNTETTQQPYMQGHRPHQSNRDIGKTFKNAIHALKVVARHIPSLQSHTHTYQPIRSLTFQYRPGHQSYDADKPRNTLSRTDLSYDRHGPPTTFLRRNNRGRYSFTAQRNLNKPWR